MFKGKFLATVSIRTISSITPTRRRANEVAPQEACKAPPDWRGQTAGGVITSLLFSVASAEAAPRIGLGVGAVLALVAGIVSMARARPVEQRPSPEPQSAPIEQILR